MEFNKLSKEEFTKKIGKLFKDLEGFYDYWYADHVGYATIGIGTAIEFSKGSSMKNQEVKKIFKEVIGREDLTDSIIEKAKALEPNKKGLNINFRITEDEAYKLLFYELQKNIEDIQKFCPAVSSDLKYSNEMVAGVSIIYNGAWGSNLKKFINERKRVNAWFEIRYRSNGGKSKSSGLANRRYIESDIFQLFENIYFDEKNPLIKNGKIDEKKQELVLVEEKKEILNFLNSKKDGKTMKQIAEEYEKKYPTSKSVKTHKTIPFSQIWSFLQNTEGKPVVQPKKTIEAKNISKVNGGTEVIKGNTSTDKAKEYTNTGNDKNSNLPEKMFVKRDEKVESHLFKTFKEQYKSVYTDGYIEEVIEGRKIEKANKNEIEKILSKYNEISKENAVILQKDFDVLRDKKINFIDETIKIQDILYYCIYRGVNEKSKVEIFEELLNFCSAKYLFKENNKIEENKVNYLKNEISKMVKLSSPEVEKNKENVKLDKKYDKYKNGEIDIDEIKIIINKKEMSNENIEKISAVKLLKIMLTELKESYKKDENNVRLYPLTRRFLDNLLIEFIKVQVGFKNENEEKYFDGYKDKEKNILRNHLLWYNENYNGIEIVNKEEYLFYHLLKIGKNLNITTMLNYWINLKNNRKLEAFKNINDLIVDDYTNYADGKTRNSDEAIIKGHFKTAKNLRDYVIEKNVTDIYSFYLDFYDLENSIEKKEMYVNQNAILCCSKCGAILKFSKIKQQKKYINGGLQATIEDVNIVPVNGSNCSPMAGAIWEEKIKNDKIEGVSALLSNAKLKCSQGGEIYVVDCGQKTEGIAVTKDKEIVESNREVDCFYSSLLKISEFVNDTFMQSELKQKLKNYRKSKEKHTIQNFNKLKEEKENLIKSIGNSEVEKNKQFLLINKKLETENTIIVKNQFMEIYFINEIMIVAKNVDKEIKSKFNPKTDSKGLVKKYGVIGCDANNKKLYNVEDFDQLVIGYLAKVGNISFENFSFEKKDEKIKNVVEKPFSNLFNINGFSLKNIWENKMKSDEELSKEKIKNDKIMEAGGWLYEKLEDIPKAQDVLNKYVEVVQSSVNCPFNEIEYKNIHSTEKKENEKFKIEEVENQKSEIQESKVESKAQEVKNEEKKKNEVQEVKNKESKKIEVQNSENKGIENGNSKKNSETSENCKNDTNKNINERCPSVSKVNFCEPIKNSQLNIYNFSGTLKTSSAKFGRTRTDSSGKPRNHQGIDIFAVPKTETYAILDGIIYEVYNTASNKGYGKTVILEVNPEELKKIKKENYVCKANGEEIAGSNYNSSSVVKYIKYSHLSEINVKKGDKVKAGDVVGKTGITGNAKGTKAPHLHLEIAFGIGSSGLVNRVNPEMYLRVKNYSDLSEKEKKNQKDVCKTNWT